MLESTLSLGLMAMELLAAEFVFGILLERRKPFVPRVIISCLLITSFVVLAELSYYGITGNVFSYNGAANAGSSLFKFALYCFIFVLTVLCMWLTYANSLWVILFYCAGGFAAQHLSANLSMLFEIIPGYANFQAHVSWFPYVAEIAVCALVYSAVWFFLVRGKHLPENTKKVRRKVLFSLSVIFICIGISRFTSDDPTRGTTALIAETLSAIISCLLILVLHFNLSEKDMMRYEVAILEELLHREKEQYKMSKENIDLINIKCHDLKHQINALRRSHSEEQLRELESAVMIYDSSSQTGNDVLDVILTEKKLYCEKNKIRLTCMVFGSDLAFMDSMDLYSLFGNALSNAIESVRGIEEEDRRCISLNVSSVGNILSVHLTNFYDGEIAFENGLPVSRADSRYHGFGMKSISYITDKYGGHMNVTAEDGCFTLDLIFPVGGGAN